MQKLPCRKHFLLAECTFFMKITIILQDMFLYFQFRHSNYHPCLVCIQASGAGIPSFPLPFWDCLPEIIWQWYYSLRMQSFFSPVLMMHHLVPTLASWRAHPYIWCSLKANLQWPLGGNLDPTCTGFFSFISFYNNRTMQDSLFITAALLFDSKFPLVLSLLVIYLKPQSLRFCKPQRCCSCVLVSRSWTFLGTNLLFFFCNCNNGGTDRWRVVFEWTDGKKSLSGVGG